MSLIESYEFDAIIIGGGFYGSTIAIELKKSHRLKKVLILEANSDLLSQASKNNQARIHEGYHYPRSFTTAYRSRVNSSIFKSKWKQAVIGIEESLYAIASKNSKVSKSQFIRFCNTIGAKLEPVDPIIRSKFNQQLVEEVFKVNEDVFDYRFLKLWAEEQIDQHGISVNFETKVSQVIENKDNSLSVVAHTQQNNEVKYVSKFVFNCSYSGLNSIKTEFLDGPAAIKQEITEMALVKVPEEIGISAVTVMDGPFFSLMPYPSRPGLHTLSHVRYTPQMSWLDDGYSPNPYQVLIENAEPSRFERMARDASRYIPSLIHLEWVDSIREAKTVLVQNETDDGRPILFRQQGKRQNYISILGGKIDNVFDVLVMLQKIDFHN